MFKEGDKVEFTINGVKCTDVVTYVDGNHIEGEVYDLTMLCVQGKLKKVKK